MVAAYDSVRVPHLSDGTVTDDDAFDRLHG